MRTALWLVGLCAAAVALALFAGQNEGAVTLFWPPYRIDLSVNLALLLLLAAFALLYLALRAWAVMLALPRQARLWRKQQRERAAHAELLDAFVQLNAGRYVRARKAAESAQARQQAMTAAGQTLPHEAAIRALTHLVAAESAQALQQRQLRDAQFERALASAAGAAPELREGLLLRSASWSLQDHDPAGALARLDQLTHGGARRTLALRTRLKAARQAGRGQQALDTARLLAKHRAFSPEAARSLVRHLVAEQIRGTHDSQQLQTLWTALSAAERAAPELAAQAAARLLALEGRPALARQWLAPALQDWLDHPASLAGAPRLRLMDALLDSLAADATNDAPDAAGDPHQWLARLEAAQRACPNDPALQYLTGMVCMQQRLWGRAELLLAQAARQLEEPPLRRRAWRALAELAQQRGAPQQALQAWQQAGRE
ncbi:MAG: heme biosynthesis protein HemY [Burkholderiaceae bacterium]|jgi:HemY protein|nr:heme biosynthesis protein HemY [Burkholderiaceae bacterium]